MSYDLLLVRAAPKPLRSWSDYEEWYAHVAPDEDATTFYSPPPEIAQKVDQTCVAITHATEDAVGIDIGFEDSDVVGVNLAYWPQTMPHLAIVADHLNAFARDLGPGWVWVDPQWEQVSQDLDPSALQEVFSDICGPQTNDRKAISWRRELVIFIVVAAGTYALLQWKDRSGGCADFEVPGERPGTCTVACLEGETAAACDARAQRLWREAGIEPELIVPQTDRP